MIQRDLIGFQRACLSFRLLYKNTIDLVANNQQKFILTVLLGGMSMISGPHVPCGHITEGPRSSLESFLQGHYLTMRAPPSWTNHLLKPNLKIPLHWGLGFIMWILDWGEGCGCREKVGSTNIQSKKDRFCLLPLQLILLSMS